MAVNKNRTVKEVIESIERFKGKVPLRGDGERVPLCRFNIPSRKNLTSSGKVSRGDMYQILHEYLNTLGLTIASLEFIKVKLGALQEVVSDSPNESTFQSVTESIQVYSEFRGSDGHPCTTYLVPVEPEASYLKRLLAAEQTQLDVIEYGCRLKDEESKRREAELSENQTLKRKIKALEKQLRLEKGWKEYDPS